MIKDYLDKASKIIKSTYYVPIGSFYSTPFENSDFPWLLESLYWQVANEKLTYLISLNYTEDSIIFKELKDMENYFCVEIPYDSREDYIEFVLNINEYIGNEGLVTLYVDNNIYHLKAYLVVEGDERKHDYINSQIKQYGLKNSSEKGFNEFFKEQAGRKWNSRGFCNDRETNRIIYLNSFEFASKKELHKKGYLDVEISRKKVFISYSWADSEVVLAITEKFERMGINLFIDRQSIDYGDKILDKIMSGLADCDLAVIFLSENFKNSYMGIHELSSMWNYVIYKKKPWRIVNLDNVDPNTISPSLKDYKYFDYQKEDINLLIESIKGILN